MNNQQTVMSIHTFLCTEYFLLIKCSRFVIFSYSENGYILCDEILITTLIQRFIFVLEQNKMRQGPIESINKVLLN